MTQNVGENDHQGGGNSNLPVAAYITVEGESKSWPVLEKLTLGSEVADVVIEDESISPKHCTFSLKNGVLCLVDHSSQKGTYLNFKKLIPGKTYLVNESDEIRVGNKNITLEYMEVPKSALEAEASISKINLENALENQSEAAHKSENDEEEPPEFTISKIDIDQEVLRLSQQLNTVDEEEEKKQEVAALLDDYVIDSQDDIHAIDVNEVELDPAVLKELDRVKVSKKRRTKKAAPKFKKIKPSSSSHILLRFCASLIDFLSCFVLLNIFLVFVDVKQFYNFLGEILVDGYNGQSLSEVQSTISSIIQSDTYLKNFVDEINWHEMASVLMVYLLFRLVTTFMFSVSLGQFFVGMKSYGNSFFKRVMGVVREFVGFILFPFFIFDLTSFVGRRTFKEVITGTHLYTSSRLGAIFLALVFLPAFFILYALSPYLKGLEVLSPVAVKSEYYESPEWTYRNKVYSELLDASYDITTEQVSLPFFDIEQKNGKRFLTLGMTFINVETGKSISIKKLKEFSMMAIYKDFVELNFFAKYFQPNLFYYVKDKKMANNKEGIIAETQDIIESSFSFKLEDYPDFVKSNGPLYAGHRDFREKIEHLIGERIRSIKLTNLAGKKGLMAEHLIGKRQYYSFIPFGAKKGKLYALSLDVTKSENKALVHHLNFDDQNNVSKRDPIAEFINGFKQDPAYENIELAQLLYERYFRLSKKFLSEEQTQGLKTLEENIEGVVQVLKENKEKNIKLLLNLTEMLNALKQKDYKYFQIDKTVTV